LDGKRKSGKTNYWTLLNYFCYSWALLQGSKSFPMPLHGNGNKIMMSVHFVWIWCPIWMGSEALFRANNAMVWKSMTMKLVAVLTSRLLVLNGACKQAVKNENSFGGSSEETNWLTWSDDVRIELSQRCILNSLILAWKQIMQSFPVPTWETVKYVWPIIVYLFYR
jgi:hypothetical protein